MALPSCAEIQAELSQAWNTVSRGMSDVWNITSNFTGTLKHTDTGTESWGQPTIYPTSESAAEGLRQPIWQTKMSVSHGIGLVLGSIIMSVPSTAFNYAFGALRTAGEDFGSAFSGIFGCNTQFGHRHWAERYCSPILNGLIFTGGFLNIALLATGHSIIPGLSLGITVAAPLALPLVSLVVIRGVFGAGKHFGAGFIRAGGEQANWLHNSNWEPDSPVGFGSFNGIFDKLGRGFGHALGYVAMANSSLLIAGFEEPLIFARLDEREAGKGLQWGNTWTNTGKYFAKRILGLPGLLTGLGLSGLLVNGALGVRAASTAWHHFYNKGPVCLKNFVPDLSDDWNQFFEERTTKSAIARNTFRVIFNLPGLMMGGVLASSFSLPFSLIGETARAFRDLTAIGRDILLNRESGNTYDSKHPWLWFPGAVIATLPSIVTAILAANIYALGITTGGTHDLMFGDVPKFELSGTACAKSAGRVFASPGIAIGILAGFIGGALHGTGIGLMHAGTSIKIQLTNHYLWANFKKQNNRSEPDADAVVTASPMPGMQAGQAAARPAVTNNQDSRTTGQRWLGNAVGAVIYIPIITVAHVIYTTGLFANYIGHWAIAQEAGVYPEGHAQASQSRRFAANCWEGESSGNTTAGDKHKWQQENWCGAKGWRVLTGLPGIAIAAAITSPIVIYSTIGEAGRALWDFTAIGRDLLLARNTENTYDNKHPQLWFPGAVIAFFPAVISAILAANIYAFGITTGGMHDLMFGDVPRFKLTGEACGKSVGRVMASPGIAIGLLAGFIGGVLHGTGIGLMHAGTSFQIQVRDHYRWATFNQPKAAVITGNPILTQPAPPAPAHEANTATDQDTRTTGQRWLGNAVGAVIYIPVITVAHVIYTTGLFANYIGHWAIAKEAGVYPAGDANEGKSKRFIPNYWEGESSGINATGDKIKWHQENWFGAKGWRVLTGLPGIAIGSAIASPIVIASSIGEIARMFASTSLCLGSKMSAAPKHFSDVDKTEHPVLRVFPGFIGGILGIFGAGFYGSWLNLKDIGNQISETTSYQVDSAHRVLWKHEQQADAPQPAASNRTCFGIWVGAGIGHIFAGVANFFSSTAAMSVHTFQEILYPARFAETVPNHTGWINKPEGKAWRRAGFLGVLFGGLAGIFWQNVIAAGYAGNHAFNLTYWINRNHESRTNFWRNGTDGAGCFGQTPAHKDAIFSAVNILGLPGYLTGFVSSAIITGSFSLIGEMGRGFWNGLVQGFGSLYPSVVDDENYASRHPLFKLAAFFPFQAPGLALGFIGGAIGHLFQFIGTGCQQVGILSKNAWNWMRGKETTAAAAPHVSDLKMGQHDIESGEPVSYRTWGSRICCFLPIGVSSIFTMGAAAFTNAIQTTINFCFRPENPLNGHREVSAGRLAVGAILGGYALSIAPALLIGIAGLGYQGFKHREQLKLAFGFPFFVAASIVAKGSQKMLFSPLSSLLGCSSKPWQQRAAAAISLLVLGSGFGVGFAVIGGLKSTIISTLLGGVLGVAARATFKHCLQFKTRFAGEEMQGRAARSVINRAMESLFEHRTAAGRLNDEAQNTVYRMSLCTRLCRDGLQMLTGLLPDSVEVRVMKGLATRWKAWKSAAESEEIEDTNVFHQAFLRTPKMEKYFTKVQSAYSECDNDDQKAAMAGRLGNVVTMFASLARQEAEAPTLTSQLWAELKMTAPDVKLA